MGSHEFKRIEGLTLVRGVGSFKKDTACLVSAAAIFAGERERALPRTDSLSCLCPLVRQIAIALNDRPWWSSDVERTAVLMPLVPVIVGTRDDRILESRAYMAADAAVRVWVPRALEAAGLSDHASALRGLDEIRDAASARAAKDAVFWAGDEAYARGNASQAAGACHIARRLYRAVYAASDAGGSLSIALSGRHAPAVRSAARAAPNRDDLLALLLRMCEKKKER